MANESKTQVRSFQIKNSTIKPEDLALENSDIPRFGFVKVSGDSNTKFEIQPAEYMYSIPTSPYIAHLLDSLGIVPSRLAIIQSRTIIPDIPEDLFLYAHKKYQVTATKGGEAFNPHYIFDNRGNTAFFFNPTDSASYPVIIEVLQTNGGYISHGSYMLFVLHDWRFEMSKTSWGGVITDWKVEVFNYDTQVWETVIEETDVERKLPFLFTVGNKRVQGVRLTINGAQGASWSSNLFYFTGWSCYYVGGSTSTGDAISPAGGTIYGTLDFHQDAYLKVEGQAGLTTTQEVVVDLRYNSDGNLEMHKKELVYKKGVLISVSDLGWTKVPA